MNLILEKPSFYRVQYHCQRATTLVNVFAQLNLPVVSDKTSPHKARNNMRGKIRARARVRVRVGVRSRVRVKVRVKLRVQIRV